MGGGLLCCVCTRRQARPQQRRSSEGEASEDFLDGATQWSGRSTSAAQRKMPTARRWMRGMNHVFDRPPPCDQMAAVAADDARASREQQAAAATIQACFRRHLARRALRALRSLVKMQAFARGAYVRKQADAAIRFMKVLVQLQVRVRVRARQLLHISRDQRSI